MVKPITQRIIKQLKSADLSLEDRVAITTALLDKIQALPLNRTLVIANNAVSINGKDLEIDQIIHFRESAIALKDNYAYKVIHEQVRYLAINLLAHKAITLEETFFYKSALWNINEHDILLDQLV